MLTKQCDRAHGGRKAPSSELIPDKKYSNSVHLGWGPGAYSSVPECRVGALVALNVMENGGREAFGSVASPEARLPPLVTSSSF